MNGTETLGAVLGRALDAYEALGLLGEEIEDEWSYVTGLVAAWRDHLGAIPAGREDEPVDPRVAAAVDAAIEEIGLISDPNRAIDWLSTFPQVVLLAVADPW